ncbi:MAG: AzlC family ABC transporter permease [Rhizobiaceae bacterium]|nr:AzlC family ABC transporter permease [Rhizobiaceae bacterium]
MTADAIPQEDEPTAATEFWAGAKLSFPVIVAASPFAFLFGAMAVKNGLSVFEATLMSFAIYGGASQMVGIDLFGQHIEPWLIVLSIFAVNFRHVLYSAAIGRKLSVWPTIQQALGYFVLTDPLYAEVERKGEAGRHIAFPWYIGFGATLYVSWVIQSGIGAYFGNLIPDPHALGMDFLLPIYFFGIVLSFRARPNWLPVVIVSGIASLIAYKTVGSPWHVSIGAAAGVALVALLPVRQGGEFER